MKKFICALGIRMVGTSVSGLLAETFGSLEPVLEADEAAIRNIPGIGTAVAQSWQSFWTDSVRHRLVSNLLEAGVAPQSLEPKAEVSESGLLSGKTVVVTGTLFIESD